MLLRTIVDATEVVAATSSRLAKIAALAAVLRELAPDEIAPAIGFLTASPRQGRDRRRAGGASRRSRSAHAETPTLTVLDVDAALSGLAAAGGRGSVASRKAALDVARGAGDGGRVGLPRRASSCGELRTGALEGVLLDAIAKASERPGAARAARRDALRRPRRDRARSRSPAPPTTSSPSASSSAAR